MKNLKGKVAALTGAGSGIGRALALALAGEGCHLALADIDAEGLAETASLINGVNVSQHQVDVSSEEAVDTFATEAFASHGQIDIIINNAGVALMALGRDMSHEDLDWVMGINFRGVAHGTRAFLPAMLERGEGHVVNISSIMGLWAMPAQSAYAASKHAVRGYSEAVRLELLGTGVGLSVVYPGVINTKVMANARHALQGENLPTKADMLSGFEVMPKSSPEKAARIIVRGIKRNKARILIGFDSRASIFLSRMMPTAFVNTLGRVVKRLLPF